MSHIIRMPPEKAHAEQIDESARLGLNHDLDPRLARIMLHSHHRFQEIQKELRNYDPTWGEWDTSVRDVARLVGIAQAVRETGSTTELTWALWAHLRLGRGGQEQLPVMEARRALGDKLDEVDGWRTWAQKALGLSDAYVDEQKLTVDDLRRMISERL